MTIVVEAHLLPPLLSWLEDRRRVRADTLIARELPWRGRRIDCVTLTSTLVATAYELKVKQTARVLEQAAYNRLAFDRSYMVTVCRPSGRYLADARAAGVGVILARADGMVLLSESPRRRPDPHSRERVLSAVRASGVAASVLS